MKKIKRNKSKDKLIGQFPEASKEEIAQINRPKFKHFTSDGRGNVKETFAPAKDGYHKSVAEGRPKLVTAKIKKVKLKDELWNANTMMNLFRTHNIHADITNWFITFNNPSRKMTAADQVTLMLAHSDTEYLVHINRIESHLIIENLEGEK